MNKTELIDQVAKDTGFNQAQAGVALSAVLNAIQGALQKGDSVTLIGFGNFSVTERAARVGRNPRTGEAIPIAASRTARFAPGKTLKDAVNPAKEAAEAATPAAKVAAPAAKGKEIKGEK